MLPVKYEGFSCELNNIENNVSYITVFSCKVNAFHSVDNSFAIELIDKYSN